MNAGLRESRTNPTTKTRVGLYQAEEAGLCSEAGKWVTVCETHGTLCNHRTRALASFHLAAPWGWCEDCRELLPSSEFF